MKTETILPAITGTSVLRTMAQPESHSDKIRGMVKKVSDAEVFLCRALYFKAEWPKDKIFEVMKLEGRVNKTWLTQVLSNNQRRNVRYHRSMRLPPEFHTLTEGAFLK